MESNKDNEFHPHAGGMSTIEKVEVTGQDVDEALLFLNEAPAGELIHVDDKKLMRRVDRMLMPLMFACYYLQYCDKTLLSNAGIMGIIKDTDMPANGFSNLAMAFYLSFLVSEPIQSFLLQRFPAAKFLGVNGCLVIITGMWYKRDEQVSRMGWWYQGTSVAPMVTALISYGFGHWTQSDPNLKFKSWQILFLLFGVITIVIGILTFLFLPDNPMKSRLRREEKIHIIERVRENQTGIENKKFKWTQFIEAVTDIKTWLLSLIVITTNVPNGAVSSFSNIITENFGYDEYTSLLLSLPGCAVAFISVWLGCWYAGQFNARGLSIIALIIPTLLGGALMAWLPATNKAGLLVGNFLTNTVGSTMPMIYSWITANFAGHTKKLTMNALVLMSFCIGNVIGPETFQAKDAPQYIPAKITIVAILSFGILFTAALDLLYMWENRKRDNEPAPDLPPNFELMDLTDKQNRNFRYLL
ncbi:hypothetical protein N7510_011811 [Penicillium lagena]|uniref:uncharacterized protein n=1 Tax=Penicillium lagena TaxID=94218 RepID=UPI00254004B9|nr:uncharacterized protein N7510_011811 [Penicillium lagena]KAJ5602277.1 hypothetical protein N7510_011811 [Penicillium lagena]